MSDTLLGEITGSVLKITLNRPDKFNSFNREMALAFLEAMKEAESNKKIRAVLLSGNGKAFCAGQDLKEALDTEGPGIKRIVEEHYNPIILSVRNLKKPVIAAVNGVAAGAGANIALACDVVLAAKSSSFIQAFSKIGLIPDSGGTFTLPRLVGWQRASALMMTGDAVKADEAFSMGMVYRVCADDQLMIEANAMAERLADMPTMALWRTKQLLNESAVNSLSQQLSMESNEQIACAASPDYNEGVNAFLEKRKPVFKGE